MLWLALLLACTPNVAETETDSDPVVDTDTDTTATETAPRWLFLVYMSGDNDLESYVSHDLNELEAVGSGDGVEVLVQADRAEGYVDDDGDWTGGRRYRITGDAEPDRVTSEVLEELPELDFGDPATLSDFLLWADERSPEAEHVAVILWGHGDGWFIAPSHAISWDETGTGIRVADGELETALAPFVEARGKPIDVVGFDACNMGAWEVAYSLRHQADVMLASPTWVGWEGLQYGSALSLLRGTADVSAAQLADQMADNAVVYGFEHTFAAIDLSKMDALAAALDVFSVAALGDDKVLDKLLAFRDEAASGEADGTDHNAYLDLADFAFVAGKRGEANIAPQGDALKSATDAAVIGAYTQDEYAGLGGLTIYFGIDDQYLGMYGGPEAPWSAATHWDETLYALQAKFGDDPADGLPF